MRKTFVFSLSSLIGMLAMATVAMAGEVTWTDIVHSSLVGDGPGPDGLMGTSDDVSDARNTSGSFSVNLTEWGTPGPSCPAQSGPDEVMYLTGNMKWCLGDPSAGQFTVTSLNESNTAIPKIGAPTTSRLKPGGGPNTGSPCGFGTSGTSYAAGIDWQLMIGPLILFEGDDEPIDGTIFLVSDNSPGPVTCPKVDGGTGTYTTQDLLAIRNLLPQGATAYLVMCNVGSGASDPDPCWSQSAYGLNAIYWTSDDVASGACDGVCGGGGGCIAATAEAVE